VWNDDWMEIQVTIGGVGPGWVGRGYWQLPSTGQGWPALVDCVSRAIMGSIPELSLAPFQYEMRIEGRIVTLEPKVSRRIRSRYNRHSVADPRQILWLPSIQAEERWGVCHGES